MSAHQEPKREVFSWTGIKAGVTTGLILLVGSFIFNSYQAPKTTLEIKELQARQDKQDVLNQKFLDGIDNINATLKEIKEILKK